MRPSPKRGRFDSETYARSNVRATSWLVERVLNTKNGSGGDMELCKTPSNCCADEPVSPGAVAVGGCALGLNLQSPIHHPQIDQRWIGIDKVYIQEKEGGAPGILQNQMPGISKFRRKPVCATFPHLCERELICLCRY